jgi:hypothetical protein
VEKLKTFLVHVLGRMLVPTVHSTFNNE